MASGIDEMRKIIREKEPPRPSTKFATLSGREQTTTARRHATECPRLISLLRGDLDWIVMKCLEKDRTRRYETATGLAADIQRHLQNEPIVARPPSAAYRLRKAWRRNKVLMTAALAVVLSLSGGILVSVHQTIKALYAKEEAVNANRTAQTERDIALEQRERAEAREEEAQRSLYAAKMNLAQQAWEEGILERVRQLLDETSSHEDRGFEWYYWQRQIHLEERTLRGHIGIVLQLAFSPDSQRLLTGSGDHTAKVWDVNTGKELFTLNQENTPTVEHPRPYGIPAVAFSPSGKLIALGSADNTIGIWDADSRERLLTFSPHDAPIWSVAFSPDERSLVTGSMGECEAKVWNVASGRPLSTLRGHTNICLSAAFSPSGRQILTASHDGTTRLWQAAGGEQCSPPFVAGLRGTYSFAAFSPSGAQIATDGENATVYVYDAAKGERLHTLQGHKTAPVSAAFSPDGLRIVTAGGDDRTAKVWDAKSGSELAVLKGHTGSVRSAVFSPDGTRIATASWDGTVKIWDAAVRLERFASTDRASTIFSVACSHDGTRIVSGDRDGRVQIWDVAIDKGLHTLTGHRNRIWSVAFSADGRRVVTGGWDRKAIIWDTSTGQAVRIIKDHPAGVRSVSFLSQGAQIITGSEDGKARIWDTDSGDLVHLLDGHTGPIFAAAVSPDGQQIVTGGFDQRVLVWDAITRKVRNTLEAQQHEVLAIAFSPDGERIVTGQSDGAGTVWDPNTGSKLATLRGHTDAIASLSFSPDGRRIVTGSWDGTVKLWDSMTGAELLSLKGGNEKIRSVAFSGAHGQRIIAAGGRGIPEIWEAASVEQVADWQQEERTAAELVAARLSEQAAKVEAHRRARATDPGAITEWLLLAPIHILQFSEALDATQIPKENLIRPHAGELVQIEGQDLFWRKVQLQDYLINFSQLLGGEWVERSVAYAVCYIESRTTQDELLLKVGHDDAVKIFLNGEELYCKSISRPYVEDLHIVEQVTLKRGINVLVYKAVNAFEDWLGSVRLTHRDGQPLQGISVKLEPDL
jgi:WD40 repeat protein